MERTVVWSSLETAGLEYLHLAEGPDGVSAHATLIGMTAAGPYRAHYLIRCDSAWETREVSFDTLDAEGRGRVLKLRVDADGRWSTLQGAPVPLLDGCRDVDFTATPFTNTLPIRRLNLSIGESTEIAVAYVATADLVLRSERQRYTRLSASRDEGTYRYEGLTTGYTTELRVDVDGLVLDYPGLFRRVWPR